MYRGNKNRKNERERSLNSQMPRTGRYCAQTSLQEVSIFLLWTGLSNTILLMILEIIFTVLAVLLEVVDLERDFCSCSLVNLVFLIS